MNVVTIGHAWRGLIDPEWIDELDQVPFLTRCRAGQATRGELRAFVVQHHYYSRHFTRYLCALLANMANEGERLELAHNLFEELGFGDFGSVPHAQIYRSMMKAIGVAPTEPILPSTEQLVDVMFTACRDPNPLVGLGALCLGAEAIVPHIYSQVVRGFLAQGTDPAALEFFKIHIEGDDAHALTMRKIIEAELAAHPELAVTLQMAARKAIFARKIFFDGIKSERSVSARRKVVHESVQL